ncbi:MAG: 50S ribosomal protein L13, partial [Bacteroidetes bacterium]|nr:50S ribosomal protein L13 [Bacteroidota bacterium]
MSKRTTQRTFHASVEDVDKKWYVVDAEGLVLGRLAANVARILRGKHKPIFSPHMDNGDFVVIINADKVRLTGKREEQKSYFTYSGYPGGGKTRMFKDLIKSNPQYVIEHAVRGMLPHNRLGRRIIKKLKVYS